jgi:hypothetical protein
VNGQRAIDRGNPNPATDTALPGYVGTLVPGVGSPIDGVKYPVAEGVTYPKLVAVPRFGFAYDVFGDKKTVIRGSAGIFTQRANLNSLPSGAATAPAIFTPQVFSSTIPSLSGLNSSFPGFPPGVYTPQSENLTPGDQPMETVYEYNLTLERDIGFNTVVSAAYVGNFDRHAQESQNINPVPFGIYLLSQNLYNNTEINSNYLRQPYVGMGSLSALVDDVSGVNYQGLQTQLQHRLTRGLTFGASYNFSKALGLPLGFGATSWDPYHTGKPITMPNGQTVTFPTVRQWYYGPTSDDRKNFGSVNFAYNLPRIGKPSGFVGNVVDVVINHWTLSGVTSFSSGAPANPTCSIGGPGAGFPVNDPTFTGAQGNSTEFRCNVVGNPNNFTQSFYTNFNVNAFAYPSGGTVANPTPTFGNAGLNVLRQPGWWNQDLTLAKNFPLGSERRMLQMSFQTYNVFNHTEFNAINTAMTFNTSGAITNVDPQGRPLAGQYSGTNAARAVVLSARLVF